MADSVARLDPFQNIVNVGWPRNGLFVRYDLTALITIHATVKPDKGGYEFDYNNGAVGEVLDPIEPTLENADDYKYKNATKFTVLGLIQGSGEWILDMTAYLTKQDFADQSGGFRLLGQIKLKDVLPTTKQYQDKGAEYVVQFDAQALRWKLLSEKATIPQ